MLFFVRYTKGLGDSAIYTRLKDEDNNFWDFVNLVWVTPIVPTCRLFMAQHDDGDPYEDCYMVVGDIPHGGPFIEEAVNDATGEVIAYDDDVMGELRNIPGMHDGTWHQKLQFIYQYLAGKRKATSVLETMLREDETELATAVLSDDGTTFTKEKTIPVP